MRKIRLAAAMPLTAVALLAGCGGGDGAGDVPADAVAVVGDETITKAEFNIVFDQIKRAYKQQNRDFPKAGSQDYVTIRSQAVRSLVQREQFAQEAEDLDIEVSDDQVDKRLRQLKQQIFNGDEKRYNAQLKQQGFTDAQVRSDVIRPQLLSEAIFKKITEDVKVSDKQIRDYYNKNKRQYTGAETRDVRHILLKTKAKADDVSRQLRGGASFAALAKKFSLDPGSKSQGGKLTISRGQTVAEFDRTAFTMPQGKISRPVKTQFGWHIIMPISKVRPAKTTPFSQVKDAIRQQLLQSKRNEIVQKWFKDLEEEYESKIAYQRGYEPPSTSTTATTTATE